jgi:hypothetical protein
LLLLTAVPHRYAHDINVGRRKLSAYEEAATQAWKDYHNNTNMDQPAVKWCAQLYESVKNGETLACIQEVRTPRTLDQLRILQAAR